MPARHRYKCLNNNCLSHTDQKKSMTFVALQSPQPTCPHCGAIKLEDWGEAINHMGGLSDNSKNSDTNFKRVADRYGLTDMNNKDGQAVKRPANSAPASGPTVKIGGIEVPISQAASGACVNMPNMAKSMTAPINQATPKNAPLMREMTRVVGEHKG